MKPACAILLIGVLLVQPGCRKGAEEPRRGVPYDKTLDGPPTWLSVSADENLLRDQAQVAQEYGAAGAGGGSGIPAAPLDPAAAVRQRVSELIRAVKTGNSAGVAGAFTAQDAPAVRAGLDAMQQIAAKAAALESLVKTQLNMQPPEDVKELGGTDLTGLFGPDFADADPAAMQFVPKDGQVVVTRPQSPPLVFVQQAGRWGLQLDPIQRQITLLFPELAKAAGAAIDEITSGIRAGTITQANFGTKTEEIGQKHIEPLMEKLMPLIMKVMSESMMPTGPETPATAPAPPSKTSF